MKKVGYKVRAMNLEQNGTKATKTERVFLRFLHCLLLKPVLAFSLLPLAFPPSASAQTPPQTENRFLFIINTSSAMRRMTNGIQEAVLGLLKSGMQGQMRDGDTFGIWTYDVQLHTDFPMQVWSKQNQNAIIGTAAGCLAQLRYQNRPHLDKVLPVARQLVAQSRVLTVIFIFDGTETMQGTGFDKDINDLHNQFGREVRAENIPFVTVLAARDGQVFDYRVRTPSSVSLPQTADLFKPAETNAVPSVAATNPPPPAVVASKPPEPRHLDIVLKPAPPPQTNPPPIAASAPVAQSAPEKREPVLQPAPRPRSEEPPPQSPNPNPNLNSNLNPNPNPTTASPEPPSPSVNPAGRAGSPLPAAAPENPAPPNKPVAAPPVTPASNPQSAPSSGASAQEEIRPPSPGLRRAGNPQSPAAPPSHPAPRAVPTAVALPTPTDHLALLVIAISLVTIAVVLVLFLMRRSRAAPSLISQSMDRPQ